MTWPDYDQLYGSRFEPESDIEVSIAPWGEASVRTDYGANVPGAFVIKHQLTAAQLATLNTAFDDDHADSFTLAWDEGQSVVNYTVHWMEPPQWRYLAKDVYDVTVRLAKDIEYGSLLLESGDYLLLENGDNLLLEGN